MKKIHNRWRKGAARKENVNEKKKMRDLFVKKRKERRKKEEEELQKLKREVWRYINKKKMESVRSSGGHILWKYYREKQHIKKGRRKKGDKGKKKK